MTNRDSIYSDALEYIESVPWVLGESVPWVLGESLDSLLAAGVTVVAIPIQETAMCENHVVNQHNAYVRDC